jgi:hypothetical protein
MSSRGARQRHRGDPTLRQLPATPGFHPIPFHRRSAKLSPYTAYNSIALATSPTTSARSFKRGLHATFAQNSNGKEPAATTWRRDSDLEVSVLSLPALMAQSVSSASFPGDGPVKKGSCDVGPCRPESELALQLEHQPKLHAGLEYVGIKQQPYWPGLGRIGKEAG